MKHSAIAVLVLSALCGCTNPHSPSTSDEGNTGTTPSSNAKLASLTVSVGSLTPSFSAEITSYSVSVANTTAQVSVSATAADAKATVVLSTSQPMALGVGTTTLNIQVKAEDATTKTYTVSFVRSADYVSSYVGTLKYVPAGSFHRDSTAGDTSVITSGYRIGQTAVTRAQFQAVMGYDPVTPTTPGSSTTSAGPTHNINWYVAIAFCNKLSLLEGLTPVYSVQGVTNWATLDVSTFPSEMQTLDSASWSAATIAFAQTWDAATCDWTANGYRLPTEAEYHWAALGAQGDYTKTFAGSNGTNAIGDYSWYSGNSYDAATSTYTFHDTATKLPNELGLYDMTGCSFAWGWDWKDVRPSGTLTDYRGASSSSSGRVRLGTGTTTPEAYVLACPDEAHRLARVPYSALATLGIRLVRS